jgi:hypothetical protein
MATARANKKAQASVLPIREIRARVDQLRKEVEGAVETGGALGPAATDEAT